MLGFMAKTLGARAEAGTAFLSPALRSLPSALYEASLGHHLVLLASNYTPTPWNIAGSERTGSRGAGSEFWGALRSDALPQKQVITC